jgi:RNA methyltransferase, TrmH family
VVKYEVNDRVIEKVAYKENTYALGVFEKYECEIESGENNVVLDQARNMGNIGTVIRTMVGFGYNNLVLISPSADIFDPTIVRSAMGALFTINFKYYDSFEDYIKAFPNYNRYLFMLNGANNMEEVKYKEPYSLVFGNESTGLPDTYAKYGEGVYIEHGKGIDSLNLSIAVGIALYRSKLK